jgi:hypothetical protein
LGNQTILMATTAMRIETAPSITVVAIVIQDGHSRKLFARETACNRLTGIIPNADDYRCPFSGVIHTYPWQLSDAGVSETVQSDHRNLLS